MSMKKCTFSILSLVYFLVLPSYLAGGGAKNHKDEEKLVGEARFLMEAWQYKKAIAAYKKLIEESSTESFIYAGGAEAHVRIGECLFHLHRYSEAADWFKEVHVYRNMGTHHNLVRMEESLAGFGDQILDAELDEITILCVDDQTKKVIRKNMKVSAGYITEMANHIRNVWSKMDREFKK